MAGPRIVVNRSCSGRYLPTVESIAVGVWRYEAYRCGRAVLAAPSAVVALAALAAAAAGGGMRSFLATWLPGELLPLTAGVAAVGIVSREVMTELHLALPARYSATVRRRLAVLGAAVLVAVVGLTLAERALAGTSPPEMAADAVRVAAFSLLLIGGGTYAAAPGNGGGPAAAVVMAGWLAKMLIWDRLPVPPPLTVGVFAAVGAWWLVRGSRRAGRVVA